MSDQDWAYYVDRSRETCRYRNEVLKPLVRAHGLCLAEYSLLRVMHVRQLEHNFIVV